MLLLEMDSGDYVETVMKTAKDVIKQLRLLRRFSNSIDKCTGFTFPLLFQLIESTSSGVQFLDRASAKTLSLPAI